MINIRHCYYLNDIIMKSIIFSPIIYNLFSEFIIIIKHEIKISLFLIINTNRNIEREKILAINSY